MTKPPDRRTATQQWRRLLLTGMVVSAVTLGLGLISSQHPGLAGADSATAAHPTTDAGSDIAYYTCAMHPSVRQPGPGTCPICSMGLTAVSHASLASGEVVIDAVRRQVIGIRTAAVISAPLHLTIRTVGRIAYDESAYRDVSLKGGGWVSELTVGSIGTTVQQGQPLFTYTSPDLLMAEREYVAALRVAGATNSAPTAELSKHSAADAVLMARDQLALWDLSPAQIAALPGKDLTLPSVTVFAPASGVVLEKDLVAGSAISAGQRLYRIASLDRVWVIADLAASDMNQVRLGQTALISVDALPGQSFSGTIDQLLPALDPATRTLRARIVLGNPDHVLRPEMFASVTFEVDAGTRLQVAKSAVLYTGPRRLVFVDHGEGHLRPVPVTLGLASETTYEVLSGLATGDQVVISGNFLVAAESRIRSAEQYWGGGDDAR